MKHPQLKIALLTLFCLLIASSCLYSAGMALNDVFDFHTDSIERPQRPIPSGSIGIETGMAMGMFLLITGCFFAFLSGWTSFLIAFFLSASILSYNMKLKHNRWLGPINMGGCRYLNLLLGMSAASLCPRFFAIPLINLIYIASLTVLSREETSDNPDVRGIFVTCAGLAVVPILFFIHFQAEIFFHKTGMVLCLAATLPAITKVMRLVDDRHRTSSNIQATMKLLLMGIIVLDGTIVCATAPFWAALLVWTLLIFGMIAARRLYVT